MEAVYRGGAGVRKGRTIAGRVRILGQHVHALRRLSLRSKHRFECVEIAYNYKRKKK